MPILMMMILRYIFSVELNSRAKAALINTTLGEL